MASLPRPDDVLAGKYRIEKVIGRGGMGVVMAAWHLELDQRVALKFLSPELSEQAEAAERFRREARASAKIRSEHVVRVLDVGTIEGGTPYMVMEYLEGRDLSSEYYDRGALPPQECADYVLQAIEAVAEAHALGIIHRDLKPENLFLAQRPDGGRLVKVLDFGISKSMVSRSEGRSLTQTAVIMGSPFYMSPEQMRAPRNVDPRTDIWSIGAILYHLLGGRPPYLADTIPQLCTMMLEADPEPLRNLRPEISPELEHVVMKCLARDISRRWGSVGELALALLPFASPSSHVHVERAERVLNSTQRSASKLRTEPEPVHDPRAATLAKPPLMPTAESPVWKEAGDAPAARQPAAAGAQTETLTQKAWESERPRSAGVEARAARSRSPRWIPFALIGGSVLVGIAVWAIGPAISTPDSPSASSAAALPAAPPASPAPHGDPAEPVATTPAPASEAVAPLASASAAAANSAVNVTEAPRPPEKSTKALASGVSAGRAPKGSTPHTAPDRPKQSSAEGLTDFGGRH